MHTKKKKNVQRDTPPNKKKKIPVHLGLLNASSKPEHSLQYCGCIMMLVLLLLKKTSDVSRKKCASVVHGCRSSACVQHVMTRSTLIHNAQAKPTWTREEIELTRSSTVRSTANQMSIFTTLLSATNIPLDWVDYSMQRWTGFKFVYWIIRDQNLQSLD